MSVHFINKAGFNLETQKLWKVSPIIVILHLNIICYEQLTILLQIVSLCKESALYKNSTVGKEANQTIAKITPEYYKDSV